ncbi:MAG TPA: HD domain-containing phosphohydrolase [Gaiellaceae bacterium]|nr:HD domain-containing phosphohydrolase [Gaiellaceae bacterium]
MRSFIRRYAANATTVALAAVLLSVSVFESLGSSTSKLALFAAVAIAAEALQRPHDELLPDALEGERFTLSAPIHLAAVLVAGPWVGAAVAGWSITAVGPFRGLGPMATLRRAAALGTSALAGGAAFTLAGGSVGHLVLPEDLLPAALAGLVYVTARTLLEGLATQRPALPDPLTAAAGVGLGIVLGFAALRELWLAIALVPLLLLVERLYGRVVGLRHEMATALETFANIVDERDPSTYGHSVRVARYVQDLASGLGLPAAEVRRLWWAGRLHDLGKVAVDATVLAKPGKLSPAEWGSVWRAPRLSARLLQRFRFAAQQAQAVEYHRERYNGSGYYRVREEDIPLAAHFLILADAFDAMTTDKPFRKQLSHEDALEEIESASGTQFHPVIARAFIAVQRGEDPAAVIRAEELATIRDASALPPSTVREPVDVFGRPDLIALAGGGACLVALGLGQPIVAAVGAVAALVGLVVWQRTRKRVSRLTATLEEAWDVEGDQALIFGRLVDTVEQAWPLGHAAFVQWNENGVGGSVQLERGADGPAETSLISWLLREVESGAGVVVGTGADLPGVGVAVAVPLRRGNSALVGFLVLCGPKQPPKHLLPALSVCLDPLGVAFAEAHETVVVRRLPVRELDARLDGQARTLEA